MQAFGIFFLPQLKYQHVKKAIESNYDKNEAVTIVFCFIDDRYKAVPLKKQR